jgi:hypothetical protein
VTISVRDGSGVRHTSFVTAGAITVPHVSMMYSVIELEIAAALRQPAKSGLAAGDSVLFRQFYPDREVGPRLPLTADHGIAPLVELVRQSPTSPIICIER